MFFRNLLIYRLTKAIDLADLEAALATKPARPCASQELSTYGFTAPIGKGEDAPLAHTSQSCHLIAARKEERILPGSVVRDALKQKIDEIEEQQMRKVYKKERDQLKDEIVQAFLPRAFIKQKITLAAIDAKAGLIFIDASSPRTAEDILSTLREALGSLPVRPLSVKIAPTATFTGWVKSQHASNGLQLLDRATLADTHEDGGKVVATAQDLGSDEIQNHLAAGKLVTHLALAWSNKLSFRLDDRLAIKGLRFDDLLQEQAEQDGGDDALAQQDASFVLQMLTFREFVPALIEALGGEEIPAGIGADADQADAQHVETVGKNLFRSGDKPEGGVDVTGLLGLSGSGVTATLHVPDENDEFAAQVRRDLAEATKFVRETGRASISSIQRKFLWGYNRAARMMDSLEEAGVVTSMNTSGNREVIRA